MAISIDTEIKFLKGVGPKLGTLLNSKGIQTVYDLLQWYPRDFEDRRSARSLSSLVPGETVSVVARIQSVASIPMGRSKRKIYEVKVFDSSKVLSCKFFRSPFNGYFDRFKPMREVRISGRVINYRGRIEFHHPDLQLFNPEDSNEDKLLPIYPETEGLTQLKLKKLISMALEKLIKNPEKPNIPSHYSEDVKNHLLNKVKFGILDPLPTWIREDYKLVEKKQALLQIHEPLLEFSQEYKNFRSPSHRRIIFDEFFELELYLALQKQGYIKEKSYSINSAQSLVTKLKHSLPFKLTKAQIRAFEEIKNDLSLPSPMNRLVQGDVGSGKTLVAFLSSLLTIEAGYQVALMAPTEILAEQHYQNATKLLVPLGVNLVRLTGKLKVKEAETLRFKIESGEAQFIIGTQALIQDKVKMKNLGLVIIDEQHRFGVEQRAQLKSKGKSPHLLVMTATPIPRTLAMTVYGDLDVSIIDELPLGRQPITTRKVFENKRDKVYGFIHQQILKGRQAYIVYPLVEESEKLDLKSAMTEYEKIKNVFPDFEVGLIHGKMKAEEKQEIMTEFKLAKIQILVSTTVIEVGVDVPNANIILIEHCERFGLSQLHQLRGRVGRGQHKSYCILMMGYAHSEEGRKRAELMETISDGFRLSEADLEMRGPGEFMGRRQSGLPGFRMAHLLRDASLLHQAREAAFKLIKKDPELKLEENKYLKDFVKNFQWNV